MSTTCKIRYGALGALGLSLLLFSACDFAVELGEPDKSKQDKELAGYWCEEISGNVHVLVAIAAKDGKTYDFEWITGEGTLAEPTKLTIGPLGGQLWLTEIGEARFATARFDRVPDDARHLGDVLDLARHVKEKPYLIVKLERSGDRLTLRKLNAKTEDFAQAKTPAEMQAAIKNHLDDSSAYDGTSTLARTTAEAVKKIREMAAAKGK